LCRRQSGGARTNDDEIKRWFPSQPTTPFLGVGPEAFYRHAAIGVGSPTTDFAHRRAGNELIVIRTTLGRAHHQADAMVLAMSTGAPGAARSSARHMMFANRVILIASIGRRRDMNHDRAHPWVRSFRNRVGWGLQAFARPDDPAPAARILAAGRLADSLGFDAFFIGDHPAYAPEAWLHLGALAVQTSQIRLGSVVLCAGYRAPVLTARLAADLDNLSAGRAILGLGHGWNAAEFAQLGFPFPPVPERQAALAETVEIIRGVWGPRPFTYHGRYHSTVNEQIVPPPLQQPGPPIIHAGAGERTALRLVARYADACNFGPGHATGLARTMDDVRRKNAVLASYCREIGRSPTDVLRTQFTTWLMLAPTREATQAKLDHYYPQGVNEEQQFSRVAASPARAVAYYQALVDAGRDYFVVQTLDAADTETIELLAREVIPHVHSRSKSPDVEVSS
jgi:alkanesulfonate monooxygenase SsuD/methylene tetrahydromethanopterin reductase-like flavin-dependent oxidoreductase (luciferase family)